MTRAMLLAVKRQSFPQSAEHDLDPVALLVAAFLLSDGLVAGRPAWDAGAGQSGIGSLISD